MLPTTFDPIFAKHAGDLPVTYLRALSKRESNMNPGDTGGPAWGLMQVIEEVRQSYNSRKGTNYSRQDLLNPDVNVAIAADLLNRIAAGYQRKHPNTPNMRPDWGNPEFVKLVTAGWNSGYSESPGTGVGHVASWLERNNLPVTHDNVLQYAQQAGGTRHLYANLQSTLNWQRSVADLFFQEGGDERGLGGLIKVGLVALIAYGLYKAMS